ncbi:hypothetical protein BDZ91DRAFT_772799 [Kalaharituber pfeilii]|nr:hypothetical protein BDZ91DRAFT_772799 [Kalaharituber pfeilii]
MAKKDKKSKKAVDNSWEDEIDTAPPAEAVKEAPQKEPEPEPESKPQDSTPPTASVDDDFMSGGLLGAIRKNQGKKKKKGKNVIDDEEKVAEPSPPEEPAVNYEAKAPVAVTEIDDDEFGPIKKGKKGGKQVQQEKPTSPMPKDEDEDEDDAGAGGDIRVKSKKEKEKEKKEREKQKKKEAAARAKAKAAAAKDESKPAAEEVPKEAPKPAAAPAAPAAAAKGKKMTAVLKAQALKALQERQEMLRRQEEEMKRLEEEERRREEEEERLRQEEEKRKEEAKARKKEKEKEKREQLKKEGKLLTKAQKEARQREQLRLQQLLESGVKVAGLEEGGAKKVKPVYDKKKKKPGDKSKAEKEAEEEAAKAAEKKAEEERIAAEKAAKEEEERRKREEEEAAAAAAEAEALADGDVIDDWEKAIDDEGNIKESWDQETEEEEEEEKPAKPAKAAANGATAKPAAASAKTTLPVGKAVPAKAPAKQAKPTEETEDEESEEESSKRTLAEKKRKEEAAERRRRQHEEAKAAASKDNLRSPICCILGHVDTGKTKLLDKVRQTDVQGGEAGGITQQIGATYFPVDAIKQKTAVVNTDNKMDFKIPGLLVIDTPGHESFTNLRSRGSSLCNIAILVVDIMHGLEPQTLESIKLLRDRKTPFIVALNKIDRLYDWKAIPDNGFRDSLSKQKKSVQAEFQDRLTQTKLAFAEQGLNAEVFYENKNMAKYVSLVPTSAHTGEGIPDMLKLLVTLTQERMAGKLMYLSELECTVLEVKVIEGLGTTIDVILSNGVLREGDRIVLCGLNGAISTNIRALLTPQPLKELRVKSQYVHHKEVKAALGVKIAANDLENAIAGSRLLVCGPDDDEEDLEEEVMSDLENLLSKVSTTGKGVAVQASTLGSLEALLEFLRTSKIPVSSISIGPVYKRDVMRAGIMLEKNKEFAVMLCFDVKIDKEAQQYADEVGVKIFTADIIYHLFDSFTAYQKQMLEAKRQESAAQAVFPCVLSPVSVFNKKDPIVVGVDVIEGSLRIGTPIAAVKQNAVTGERDAVVLGRVTSMHINHKPVTLVKKGQPSVAIKVEGPNQPLYGRQLDEKDTLYSHISRVTIDTLKNHYRDEVAKEDWALIVQLKKVFNIA